MRICKPLIFAFFLSFLQWNVIAQESSVVPAVDTLSFKRFENCVLNASNSCDLSLNVLPALIREEAISRHEFIEDTLLVYLANLNSPHEQYNQVAHSLSTAKDSTSLVLAYYAITESRDTIPGMKYVYTTKKYWYEYDGRKRCFLTNWGGYIQEGETSLSIYTDKVSSPIPFMMGCVGDDFKAQSPLFPYQLVVGNEGVKIRAIQADWDCYFEVTLAIRGDEVKSVGMEEGECDY